MDELAGRRMDVVIREHRVIRDFGKDGLLRSPRRGGYHDLGRKPLRLAQVDPLRPRCSHDLRRQRFLRWSRGGGNRMRHRLPSRAGWRLGGATRPDEQQYQRPDTQQPSMPTTR